MNLTSSAWNINPVLLSFNVPWSVECFETISKDVNSSSTVSGSNWGDATFIESKHDMLRKTSKLIVPMPLFESEIQIVALLCSPPISLQIFSTSSISPFPLWDLLLNSFLLSFEHFTSNNSHQIKSLKASAIGNFPPFTCTKCHQHCGQLLNLSLFLCSKMSVCQVFPCHLRPTSCSWSHKSSPYLHWTLTGIRFNVTGCKEKKNWMQSAKWSAIQKVRQLQLASIISVTLWKHALPLIDFPLVPFRVQSVQWRYFKVTSLSFQMEEKLKFIYLFIFSKQQEDTNQ